MNPQEEKHRQKWKQVFDASGGKAEFADSVYNREISSKVDFSGDEAWIWSGLDFGKTIEELKQSRDGEIYFHRQLTSTSSEPTAEAAQRKQLINPSMEEFGHSLEEIASGEIEVVYE